MKNSTRIAAITVLFFNAISAIFGGGCLVYDPTGKFLQLPSALLEHTPFDNFMIPGIILLSVNGLFNLFVGIVGLRNGKYFAALTIVCGLLLIVWLSIQILIIKQFSVLAHFTYYIVGIIMIFLGIMLKKQKRTYINDSLS